MAKAKATKSAKRASKSGRKRGAGKASKASKAARAAAKPAKPIVMVVEGDSWERLPDWGPKGLPTVGGTNFDLSRALQARGHIIHNLAYWGDTIADIARAGDYVLALRHTKAPFLLLGGGGNDILGEGRLKTYLRLFAPEREPGDYILDTFYSDLRRVILHYVAILDRIAADPAIKNTKVIVHGYDYGRPMRLGWIGEPMEFVGIGWDRPELQNGIVKILIDALNTELAALAAKRDKVIYVDFRNKVGNRWHDELHPRREAFDDLASILEAAVA
jgi:hypothetical protein